MDEPPSTQSARTKAGTAQSGIAAGVMTPASSDAEWDVDSDEKSDHHSISASPSAPSHLPPHSALHPHLTPPSPLLNPTPADQSIRSLPHQLTALRATITNLESRLEAGKQEVADARELLRLKDFIIVESARQTSEVERELEAWRERVKKRDGEIERLRGEMKGEMRGVVRRRGSGGGERRGVEGERRGVEKRREIGGIEWAEGKREDRWRGDGWGGGVVREKRGAAWVDVRVRVRGGGVGG